MITKRELKPGSKPWTLDDVKDILDGKEADGSKLVTPDRNHLSPVSFAALQAARTADSLTPLLELLAPPTADEQNKIDQILTLLEQIASNQVALHERMLSLESRVSGCDVRLVGKPTASVIHRP